MSLLCAVTGANGYIGSYCTQRLLDQGHRVLKLIRKPTDDMSAVFDLKHGVHPDTLAGVDVLIHCAYDFQAMKRGDIFDINVTGSIRLFQTAKDCRIPKLIFISSIAAYENCRSLYGRGKLEVEKAVLNLDGLLIRPGLVYGDNRFGIYGGLYKMTGLPVLPVFNGGRQLLGMVHIDDLKCLIGYMATQDEGDKPHQVVAAHPNPVLFRDILLKIAEKRGKRIHFISIPGELTWALMKMIETFGITVGFRSDSLLGLLYPVPGYDASGALNWGVEFRAFMEI